MKRTVHISPEWDVVSGHFIVRQATVRGLAEVRGGDRRSFEESVRMFVPKDTSCVIIAYSDNPKTLDYAG